MKADILVQISDGNWISNLIGWATKSKYCHCAVIITDKYLVEATFKGVEKNLIKKYNNYEVYHYPEITHKQVEKIRSFLEKEMGDAYDFGSVLYLGWQFLTNQRDKVNAWDKENKWFCSELVDAAFKYAGIDLCPEATDNVTPADLANSKLLKKILDARKA